MLQLLSSLYEDRTVALDIFNVDPLIKNINILLTTGEIPDVEDPAAAPFMSATGGSVDSKLTSPPGIIGSDVREVALEYISPKAASSLTLVLLGASGLVIGSPSGSPYNSSLSIMQR